MKRNSKIAAGLVALTGVLASTGCSSSQKVVSYNTIEKDGYWATATLFDKNKKWMTIRDPSRIGKRVQTYACDTDGDGKFDHVHRPKDHKMFVNSSDEDMRRYALESPLNDYTLGELETLWYEIMQEEKPQEGNPY